jgi:hypothetical protein
VPPKKPRPPMALTQEKSNSKTPSRLGNTLQNIRLDIEIQWRALDLAVRVLLARGLGPVGIGPRGVGAVEMQESRALGCKSRRVLGVFIAAHPRLVDVEGGVGAVKVKGGFAVTAVGEGACVGHRAVKEGAGVGAGGAA